jgi:hypothetical protein
MSVLQEQAGLPEFSLAHGAPFFRLQERCGLVGTRSLRPVRRAALFAVLAWLPLLILTLAEGTALQPEDGRAFVYDFTVHARLLLAIPLFIVLEVVARQRLDRLLRQFVAAEIVPKGQVEKLKHLVGSALARRNSGLVEALILVVAIAASFATVRINVRRQSPSWIGSLTDGSVDLTAAGWWYLLIGGSLFFFLLFRWLWRYGIWVNLLRQIAKLDLRLVATHPDRAGGLAFIGQYPVTFALFAFAVSSVAAAAIAKDLLFGGATVASVKFAMVAWIVVLVLLLILPLSAFAQPLKKIKRQGLLDYAALASRHNLAFEQRWIREQEGRETEILGVPDFSSLADLGTGYDAIRSMKTMPLGKEAIVPVVLAALVPMLVAAATQIPVGELLKLLKLMVL